MLTIGELSRRAGVKVPTIRYYEQTGLLSEPERSEGNQRRYTQSDLDRLTFIRHGRDLGLSVDAIRDLIALSGHPDAPCDGVNRIAQEHLADVRARIERLQKLEAELARIVALCDGNHAVKECRVLEALSDHGQCCGTH
ncbi:MAG: helix-turn-helix domain-containing protein [Proteobacteria bacterium]|nr:helix-turn-helix domain-containing protein [Pseudomonadota bacterium]